MSFDPEDSLSKLSLNDTEHLDTPANRKARQPSVESVSESPKLGSSSTFNPASTAGFTGGVARDATLTSKSTDPAQDDGTGTDYDTDVEMIECQPFGTGGTTRAPDIIFGLGNYSMGGELPSSQSHDPTTGFYAQKSTRGTSSSANSGNAKSGKRSSGGGATATLQSATSGSTGVTKGRQGAWDRVIHFEAQSSTAIR